MPIHQTTSYRFRDTQHAADLFALKEMGWIYTRLMNPTTDVLEHAWRLLDGGVGGQALSSGPASDHGGPVEPGGLWTSHRQCRSAVRRHDHAAGPDLSALGDRRYLCRRAPAPESVERAIRPETRAVYIESLANPKNDVLDYAAIADAAHRHGVPVVCDNTVLTPMLFRPFEHGVDISVYSTTKFIGGYGTSIGGVIVDSGNFDWTREPEKWPQFTKPDASYHGAVFQEAVGQLCYSLPAARTGCGHGSAMSPFNVLPVPPRARDAASADAATLRKCGNGRRVSPPRIPRSRGSTIRVCPRIRATSWLAAHPPRGARAILGFGIQGGREAARKFIEAVKRPRIWQTSATPSRW